ncbi:afadin- and alpha-actinin-binding protein isoform X2 [Dunckerocampus dactyliophorus]|uniref:afadin- and alpha-actinin-binding protein isoform X2 n=1 Tax=Dunckerocampus dactyliophorus TaxID=161453 RepID=UPI0024055932|nr:afadin- and alpha-actinin-binding protein isoform X2 [Dunckerocampus dactyliophorus]
MQSLQNYFGTNMVAVCVFFHWSAWMPINIIANALEAPPTCGGHTAHMASRFSQKQKEFPDSYLQREASPLSKIPHQSAASLEYSEHADSLREQLKEMDEHAVRLQDMLKCERAKSTRLQLRCNQQEAELKRREQQSHRMKERLTDRHKDRGHSIEVLNFPLVGGGRRAKPIKSPWSTAKQEEAALRLMLERREAELREAMKLRHSITTLLHALRVDMEQDAEGELPDDDKRLTQAEAALGDHVTGGVVERWKRVQRKLADLRSEGHIDVGTDHDKLLSQLHTELKESQQIVRLQQQMLQDSLISHLPSELADSYYLEEWERLRVRWAELQHQKRTFKRERQSFTDAAIRLSRERLDFEHQRASLLKQQYLCGSALCTQEVHGNKHDGTLHRVGPAGLSGCVPISPSSTESSLETCDLASGVRHGRVATPRTPQLYAALGLSYQCSAKDGQQQSEGGEDGTATLNPSQAPPLDCSF